MPNPKASSATKGYRQTIRSKDASGNVFTTTNYESNVVRQGSTAQPTGGGSKSSPVGNPVEMFVVGALFIWFLVSGKMKAIIDAGRA